MKNQNFDIFDDLWSSPSTMPDESDVISDETIVSELKSISDLEISDDEQRSILMNAVIYERPLVVEYLLKKGVNIDKSDDNGFTALHFAIQANNVRIIEMLLKSGANPNIKNKFGNNAIICANNEISIETFKLLLKYGSDPYQKNNYGVSAFDVFSADKNFIEIIENRQKLLLESKSEFDIKPLSDNTSLKDKLKKIFKK